MPYSFIGIAQVLVPHLGGAVVPWYRAGGAPLHWAAYQPKGAASLAASLVDLSGNGHNAGNPGGEVSPTWNATDGWIFDGLAQYLTTTFVAAEDQSQSVLMQFTGAITNGGYACGSDHGANREIGIIPISATSVRYWNGATVAVAPQLAAGNLAIAGSRGYRNGTAEGAAIGAWAGATIQAFYIGGKLDIDTPGAFCQVKIQALAIYDVTLTAPQVAAVATAMANL